MVMVPASPRAPLSLQCGIELQLGELGLLLVVVRNVRLIYVVAFAFERFKQFESKTTARLNFFLLSEAAPCFEGRPAQKNLQRWLLVMRH